MTVLDLYLDGALCGSIEQAGGGNLLFHYDAGYRVRPHPTPLSLSMPLAAGVHKKRTVLPFLQGLLPDNDEALGAMARRFGVSARSPFALLEHVGSDVAGAVEIVGAGIDASDADQGGSRVRPVDRAEIGLMLSHVVSEYTDGVPYDDPAGRFSLAGAQPKIALHRFGDGSWGVPEDSTPTTHILKPAVGQIRRLDVVEQLTMHAAAYLGLDVAETELETIAGWDVFVTRRYDRAYRDGVWRRLHQEDLCQALAVTPAKKYQHRDGGPGLSEIAKLLRSLPFEADRRAAGQAFYRAFVFNVVAGCTDAHAKNYSLMLEGAFVRLAPLYDLATYAPYWNGVSPLNSAMSVGGEYRFDRIGGQNLAAAGRQFGVSPEDARDIVEATREGVVEGFEYAIAHLAAVGPEVMLAVDDLMRGLRRLPLVPAAGGLRAR
ncbi:hypothetical protein B7R21_13345 [Subtercola boreus]|uniref:Phosphatidylinositol kinase n=1 Tax=Subtercola boreus TaxID=120213 RepID=A0A3E0VPY7_9MICO|nr:HipA domain-containing protein [Subtercola boreus]RFA11433.1 hypothetical protein B7R21_13345 [Subtercola boreus]